MPELRRDVTRSEWVIVAPERAMRPLDFVQADSSNREEPSDGNCPFCAGNEHQTPPEILRIPNKGQWAVRVFPNKFPALQAQDGDDVEKPGSLYGAMCASGAHEVIVESPNHLATLADLTVAQITCVIDAYISRFAALSEDPRHSYIQLFKNHGKRAGASLRHPHSQVIALPVIPPAVGQRLDNARAYYDRTGHCLICNLLQEEFKAGARVVGENRGFAVWAPYASRFPFELVICPKEHAHDLTRMTAVQRKLLSCSLSDAMRRIQMVLGDVPYNLILNAAPTDSLVSANPENWKTLHKSFHWTFSVLPRLTYMAGLEWGAGIHINPMAPEQAAEALRKAHVT